jgi:hypothetical protein
MESLHHSIVEVSSPVVYGNVKRLKRLDAEGRRLVWYSGNRAFKIVDTEQQMITHTFIDVFDGLPNEALGFFDVMRGSHLIASSYAEEKRMLYLYDLVCDEPVLKRRRFENSLKSSQGWREIYWKDYQYFNGCISQKAGLLVLGGKVERRFFFDLQRRDKVDWEGALFTFKFRDCSLYECEPFIVVHADEPVYQLKLLEDALNPQFICATRTKRLFISHFDYQLERWSILRSLSILNDSRRPQWPAFMELFVSKDKSQVRLSNKNHRIHCFKLEQRKQEI